MQEKIKKLHEIKEKIEIIYSQLEILVRSVEDLKNTKTLNKKNINCCVKIREKHDEYRKLYKDLINQYNFLLKKTKTKNATTTLKEITNLHSFCNNFSEGLIEFDNEILKLKLRLISLKKDEELTFIQLDYNMPSVPKHLPKTRKHIGGHHELILIPLIALYSYFNKKTKKNKTNTKKTRRRKK